VSKPEASCAAVLKTEATLVRNAVDLAPTANVNLPLNALRIRHILLLKRGVRPVDTTIPRTTSCLKAMFRADVTEHMLVPWMWLRWAVEVKEEATWR
jgi:hypothetical protein